MSAQLTGSHWLRCKTPFTPGIKIHFRWFVLWKESPKHFKIVPLQLHSEVRWSKMWPHCIWLKVVEWDVTPHYDNKHSKQGFSTENVHVIGSGLKKYQQISSKEWKILQNYNTELKATQCFSIFLSLLIIPTFMCFPFFT